MKNIALILMFFIGIASVVDNDAFAQKKRKKKKGKKAKNEKKEWKKKMKKVDPLDFKAMTEKLSSLQKENSALRSQVNNFDQEKAQLNAQIAEKNEQVAQLQEELSDAQSTMSKESNTATAMGDGEDWSQGVVYRVQIGAFRNKDLTQFQNTGNFWMEDRDGLKKYTIANFRDYNEASTFKDYMREMGVKDAWIVSYEDNIRKDINEVLDNSSNILDDF